jgi:histone acetyltransferase
MKSEEGNRVEMQAEVERSKDREKQVNCHSGDAPPPTPPLTSTSTEQCDAFVTKKRKAENDNASSISIKQEDIDNVELSEQPLKKQKLDETSAELLQTKEHETVHVEQTKDVSSTKKIKLDETEKNRASNENENLPGTIETNEESGQTLIGDDDNNNNKNQNPSNHPTEFEGKGHSISMGHGNIPENDIVYKSQENASLNNTIRDKKFKSTSASNGGNPYESLKYMMVNNDGKPESLIKLVALKSLFSKQLPKMPRAYIARLVFDRRHVSLAILNENPATKDTDEEVIGAICYRPFYDMRFAEIAFCAVDASHQVKGYGTKLMNLVKQEGARTGIEYFITYADNYAIGYFKKQGFSKSISMPKGRYQGLIKDYDGGTMMECYVHPSIDFTRIPEMLAAQRKFILSRIRLKAQSTKVYDPLPKDWSPNLEGVSRGNEAAARALAIPGMVEAGWTMSDLISATGQGKDLDRAKNALKSELLSIVRKVEEQQFSWPFREPVDTTEVKDYLEIIKEPIDLSSIDKRIRKGDHYKSKRMLYADLMLMVNNCKLYNDEASTYMQCARNLESYLKGLFANT